MIRRWGMILDRALSDGERGLGQYGVTLTPVARQRLIRFGNGDARAALSALDFAVRQTPSQQGKSRVIDEEQTGGRSSETVTSL